MLASSLVGVAAVGVVASSGLAYANTNHQDTLADAISSKFNVNKTEVQEVIKGERQKHHGEHINQLVKEGKLTQAQADKLKAKEKEMKPKREAAHNEVDATKRKAARDAIRTEMDQWAKDNGIDLSSLRPNRGHGGHRLQERGVDGDGEHMMSRS